MKYNYQDNIFGKLLQQIKEAINGTKFQNHVFLVGGAVRDSLLGMQIKDIDICVDIPNGGIEFAEWMCKKYNCFKENSNPCVFQTYGTAKFSINNVQEFNKIEIECVQTRKEQYKHDSRKPETVFGTIEEDGLRRDLTINALYVNLSTDEIIDPSKHGLEDLRNKIIRTPSNPDVVFEDDPLRMIRVIRFATKLNWGINKETWLGIIKNIKRIDIVSKERITDELSKILMCKKPSDGFIRLLKCGLLKIVLPEVFALRGVKQGIQHFGDVFEHTMKAIDNSSEVKINRWATLLHDIGKPAVASNVLGKIHFFNHETVGATLATVLLKNLKFSNDDIDTITVAIKNHMRFKQSNDNCPSWKTIKKFINDVGIENVPVVLDVINADNLSHAKHYCAPNQVRLIWELIKSAKEEQKKINIELPIDGKDIMKMFNLKPSKEVGIYLNIAKEFMLENENATKEECLAFLSTQKI